MKKARAAQTETDERMAIIAERLTEARKRTGLTQLQVAEQINRTQSAVSDWERGARLPSVLELMDLVTVYRVKSYERLLRVRPEQTEGQSDN